MGMRIQCPHAIQNRAWSDKGNSCKQSHRASKDQEYADGNHAPGCRSEPHRQSIESILTVGPDKSANRTRVRFPRLPGPNQHVLACYFTMVKTRVRPKCGNLLPISRFSA